MKIVFSILGCLLTVITLTSAEDSPAAANAPILPTCALACLATALSNSTCAPTDLPCICTNVPLNTELSICVQSTCTIRDSLATLNGTSIMCNAPVRDRSGFYIRISSVFCVMGGLAVLARFFSKLLTKVPLWWDDWVTVWVLVLAIALSSLNSVGELSVWLPVIAAGLTIPAAANLGIGRDMWTVPFGNIDTILLLFYCNIIFYFAAIASTKIVLLLFFLRIFVGNNFRKLVYGTIVFNVLFGLSFVLVSIFQCKPISLYWTSWDGAHLGKCININAVSWSNSAISIGLDIWMLSLPLSQLRTLNMNWRKKIGVGIMFSVGIFITIVSILRLQSLVSFAKTGNATWDFLPVGYWSVIEVNVGLLCICLPSIRLLLVRIFPTIMGSTHQSLDNESAKPKFNSYLKGQITKHSKVTTDTSDKTVMGDDDNIVQSKSFQSKYSNSGEPGHDETRLVQLEELDHASSRIHSRASESS